MIYCFLYIFRNKKTAASIKAVDYNPSQEKYDPIKHACWAHNEP